MAALALPLGDLNRGPWWDNMGIWLVAQFEKTGSKNDIDSAIQASGKALEAMPSRHLQMAAALANLAVRLGKQFMQFGEMKDINKAVLFAESTVKASFSNPLNRLSSSVNFGSFLSLRFGLTQDLEDINRVPIPVGPGYGTGPALFERSMALSKRTTISPNHGGYQSICHSLGTIKWDESSELLEGAVVLLPTLYVGDALGHLRSMTEDAKLADDFVAVPSLVLALNATAYRCDAFMIRQDHPVTVLELPKLYLKDVGHQITSFRTGSFGKEALQEDGRRTMIVMLVDIKLRIWKIETTKLWNDQQSSAFTFWKPLGEHVAVERGYWVGSGVEYSEMEDKGYARL
ncbi:hypothetical protein MKX08_001151 [Trichoderma sp. CBMAI-0020]|nr:hypothetical protein MKX08_001151 [Trichoderma sp. CBMAI-0020]